MAVPEKLGKYEIRRQLGAGGAGTVYEAWDPIIGRLVAVKTMHLTDDFDASVRFRREAQAAGGLIHPNIVTIFDFGTDADVAYIVMERVEGGSLKDRLDRGPPLSQVEIVGIMQDLLVGLEYSHDRGVVHRDIKPGNVLLTRDGRAKVADFGIARLAESSLTTKGFNPGTPAYMSPEQIGGAVVDRRSDIWSAGVMLYRMLAGELPFTGGDTAMAAKIKLTMPIAPSSIRVTSPKVFDGVVLKALAKQPADRFDSAADFALAVREAAEGRGLARPRTSAVAGVAVVAALFLAVGGWLLISGGNAPTPEIAVTLPPRFPARVASIAPPAPSLPDPAPVVPTIEGAAPIPPLPAPVGVIALPAPSLPDPAPRAPVFAATRTSPPLPAPPPPGPAREVRDCPTCPEMVLIPAGSFSMGVTPAEEEREKVPGSFRNQAQPLHDVTIGKAFYLGKYAVTVGEFRLFVKAKGPRPKGCWVYEKGTDGSFAWLENKDRDWEHPGFPQKDGDPVVCVDPKDADEFVAWLSQVTHQIYRLPSEAEWEYAARAKTTTARYWGDGRDKACLYANVADRMLAKERGWGVSEPLPDDLYFPCIDNFVFTAPVGSFLPNSFGLYDMLGNVWQWTGDTWHENYTGAPADGSPWTTAGSDRLRVLRGGSWAGSPWVVRSGTRDGYVGRDSGTGFRLARTL